MIKLTENIHFTDLFNALADAMLLIDSNGKIIFANDTAHELLSYKAEELIGLTIESLIPKAYRKNHIQYRQQFVEQEQKRVLNGKQFQVLTCDGKELQVEIGLSPINDKDQKYTLITLHTIDKQIAAEISLKASEERLRLAKASAGLGVLDINLLTNEVHYDEIVGQIFGFIRNFPIEYKQLFELIDLDDQETWQATLNKATKTSRDADFTLEFRVNNRLKNEQRWVHVAGTIFFEHGFIKRMLGVMQDVTENKHLQQKISKQRMELETLAKTQIAIQTASAIAHEINQPLAAISAYSEVALYALNAEKMDADRLNRSLTGCVTQANRAGKSLHELMDFLQKGKIEAAPIDLNEVVNEAINITKYHGYEQFKTDLQLEDGLPHVLANRTQLQKVLVNLLRNGVEAVHSAGVPIAEIQVSICTHAESNMAEVIIQDNGPGLTNEAVDRIFEPFFTTKAHGIGMGLAISRNLIEACGGQLWFDKEAQLGAKFHLTLPFVND